MQNITIGRCDLSLTGDELILVIRGLQELPYKLAAPALAKIESEVKRQYADAAPLAQVPE